MPSITYCLDRSRKLNDPKKPGTGKLISTAETESRPGAPSGRPWRGEARGTQAELDIYDGFIPEDDDPPEIEPDAANQSGTGLLEEEPFQPLKGGLGVERCYSPLSVNEQPPEITQAPRVTQQRAARGVRGGLREEEPACISDIFRSGKNTRPYEARLQVYPGVLMLHSEGKIVPGHTKNAGRKNRVTSFSKKSRNNLLKHFGMMVTAPEMWQTFTFADDVMKEKSIEDRKDYSGYCLNRFEKYLNKFFPKIGMTWRREWETRKQGSLAGELCPHFHVMYYSPDTAVEEYQSLVICLAEEWVRITGTKDPAAIKVALHRKSYAFLDSRTKAMKYVSKYLSKGSMAASEGQSIGRSWGIIGNIVMAEPEEMKLTDVEAVMLFRFLRRYAKRKRSLARQLSGGWVHTFVLISQSTIERILRYIEDRITEEGRML